MDSTVIQNKFDEDLRKYKPLVINYNNNPETITENLLELPDDMEEYLHATQEEIDRRRRKCMEEDEENQRNFDVRNENINRQTQSFHFNYFPIFPKKAKRKYGHNDSAD